MLTCMSTHTPQNTRRGLAVASIVVGALGALMIIGFWLIGAASDGQGLSNGVVVAVLLFYGSVAVGVAAILLGIAAIALSRPRWLGVIGAVLGAVPLVVIGVAPSFPVG